VSPVSLINLRLGAFLLTALDQSPSRIQGNAPGWRAGRIRKIGTVPFFDGIRHGEAKQIAAMLEPPMLR